MEPSPLKVYGCIPAYNEETRIAPVIARLKTKVDKIIVCDDGSTDLTATIAEMMGAEVIRHPNNMGKGVALRTLFKTALGQGADAVVTIDADGQHNPDEAPRLLAPILAGSADVVNGNRLGSDMPTHRKMGNRLLTGMTNSASGTKILDAQSGFRAYSARAISKLNLTTSGMGIDSEIVMEASKLGLRIEEVEVSTKYHPDSSTHHPARHIGDVALSIIGRVIQSSPLRYLSIPGVVLLVIGFSMIPIVLNYYVAQRYFSVPFSILSIAFILFGSLLFIAGLILYAIARMADRMPPTTQASERAQG